MTLVKNTRLVAIVTVLSVSIAMMFALTAQAHAFFGLFEDDGDVNVSNHNNATVTNNVTVDSDTGDNDADGDDGGDGGEGGNARGAHRNIAGDGGRGGDGGWGGIITTGNASSWATVANRVNDSVTTVDDCACEGGDGGDVDVHNRNQARVTNNVNVDADTGDNNADGDDGGDAGDGGNASSRNNHWWGWWNNSGRNVAGDGGNGGEGGSGGDILTGHAMSDALVDNVVNRNVTRIRR